MTSTTWTVHRWMSKEVQTVRAEQPLVDAFELMRVHRIRHVPVIEGADLVGIVSDRDVRHALPMRTNGDHEAVLYGNALMHTKVAEVMSRHPVVVESDTTIREAAEICCREKISALPVVDDGELVGIVSSEDLLWAFVDNTEDVVPAR